MSDDELWQLLDLAHAYAYRSRPRSKRDAQDRDQIIADYDALKALRNSPEAALLRPKAKT